MQGSEVAWLDREATPRDLAAAGNDFFCPGGHKPLGAAIERWHWQITVTGLPQSW